MIVRPVITAVSGLMWQEDYYKALRGISDEKYSSKKPLRLEKQQG